MTVAVLAAVAQFERDQLIERTNAGLKRAWAEGKKSGCKPALSDDARDAIRTRFRNGKLRALARAHGVSSLAVA
jgi:putative DNA-invertase from lambdoid prophage Rac